MSYSAQVDLEFEGVGGTEGCQTADRYQVRVSNCTDTATQGSILPAA